LGKEIHESGFGLQTASWITWFAVRRLIFKKEVHLVHVQTQTSDFYKVAKATKSFKDL